jgi:hypothetical protein
MLMREVTGVVLMMLMCSPALLTLRGAGGANFF